MRSISHDDEIRAESSVLGYHGGMLRRNTVYYCQGCIRTTLQKIIKPITKGLYLGITHRPSQRVMIAQWENERISLSALSAVRVMIAQWENECISLSVLSAARVMIAQWENECISLSSPWPGS